MTLQECVDPATVLGFAAAAQNARLWRHHRYRGTDGPRVICSSQILAGSQLSFRSGWQAEIVEGVTLAIALSTQLHITMMIQRHTYPLAVLLCWHRLCDFVFV